MSAPRQLPPQEGRVETGVVQFGDDWPGIFIRGDQAAYYAHCLEAFAMRKGDVDMFTQWAVEGLVRFLRSCAVRPSAFQRDAAPPATSPPAGYRPLPEGHRCRCLRLWQQGDTFWCCNGQSQGGFHVG